MHGGAVAREDRHRRARTLIVGQGAALLVLSGLFAPMIALHPDGSHGAAVDPHPVRLAVFVVVALMAFMAARTPHKPDVRVAKALMLAAAVIPLVVGLADLLEATGAADQAIGAAPYLQLVAVALFLIARWGRPLWPTTTWALDAEAGTPARRGDA